MYACFQHLEYYVTCSRHSISFVEWDHSNSSFIAPKFIILSLKKLFLLNKSVFTQVIHCNSKKIKLFISSQLTTPHPTPCPNTLSKEIHQYKACQSICSRSQNTAFILASYSMYFFLAWSSFGCISSVISQDAVRDIMLPLLRKKQRVRAQLEKANVTSG